MAENKNVLCKFFQKGVNQQPEQLLNLLQKTTSNFNGVAKFDSNKDISRYPQVLPNCWKLPVITLTSIAIALLGSRAEGVENLRRGVSQSLKYVSIVDEILDPKGLFKRVRDAADEAWSDLHLSGKFLNEDLRQMGCEGNTSKGVLSKLCDIARDYISENVKRYKHCSRWPNKLIAAYSMQRISYSVLSEKLENESLFEHISVMIADILGACLTNLPEAITAKCSSVSIEKREETVQKMAHIIGETEEILKVLQKHRLPDLATKRVDIDEWRRSLMAEFRHQNPVGNHLPSVV
nr:ATP-dependent RNA helicase [Ipomoea batatas]